MDLMEALYQRRAVRHYTGEPVAKEAVSKLLLAATWAPSAVNQQPWAFGVIQGRERLAEYSERAKRHLFAHLPQALALHRRSDQLTSADYNVFHHAGTVIVIFAKPSEFSAGEDCCLAAQNLMLAAHALGLGTCPIGFVRPWFELPETKSELGISLRCTAIMPIAVGHPAGKSEPIRRLEPEIVCWSETAGEMPKPVPSAPPAIGPSDRLVAERDAGRRT